MAKTAEGYLSTGITEVIRLVCQGLVESCRLAGDDLTAAERRAAIYENALFLAFRLLFVLYAEARDLLPLDIPRYRAVCLHDLLAELRDDHKRYPRGDKHAIWSRVQALFALIYNGDGDPDSGVHPYPAGLFDPRRTSLLASHPIRDELLASALIRLSTMPMCVKGRHHNPKLKPIDYRGLSVRHLGSLYEQALEYRLALDGDEHPVGMRQISAEEMEAGAGADGIRPCLPLAPPCASPAHAGPKDGLLAATPAALTPHRGRIPSAPTQTFVVSPAQNLDLHASSRATPMGKKPGHHPPDSVGSGLGTRDRLSQSGDVSLVRTAGERKATGSYYTPEDVVTYVVRNTVGAKLAEMKAQFYQERDAEPRSSGPAGASQPFGLCRNIDVAAAFTAARQPVVGHQPPGLIDPWPVFQGVPLPHPSPRSRKGCGYTDRPSRNLGAHPGPAGASQPEAAIREYQRTPDGRLVRFIDEKVLGIRILDPAMGSGHFLIGAVHEVANFIADLLDEEQGESHGGDGGPASWARRVAERCIFGVDSDELGVELARACLALSVGTPGEPLIVLDRHLRRGDSLTLNWETEFPEAFPPPSVGTSASSGFDIVLGNPPYADLPAELSPILSARYASWDSGELYTPFVELMAQLAAVDGYGGMVLPLSMTFSSRMASLRESIEGGARQWLVSSFDRIPDALFGSNVRTRNSILLMRPAAEARFHLSTGPLTRWFSRERSALFDSLKFYDAGGIPNGEFGWPKLGSDAQAEVLRRLMSEPSRLGDIFVSGRSISPHVVYYSETAYNWLTATRRLPPVYGRNGEDLSQTKYGAIGLESDEDAWFALGVLTSLFAYWFWLVYGDGFDVTKRLLGAIPISPRCFSARAYGDLAQLGRQIQEEMEKHVVFKWNAGRRVGNYNLRHCRHITRQVDAIIFQETGLGPDLLADIVQFCESTVKTELRAPGGMGCPTDQGRPAWLRA